MKTYQDLQASIDKATFVLEAIREHRASTMYKIAYDAEQYDRKRNVTILSYQKLLYTLSGRAVPDNYSANHKVVSGFFNRFITQQNQYLLGNGVNFENESNKQKLGTDFDIKLQQAGHSALVQGVSFGFPVSEDRNINSPRKYKLIVFKLTEFVPLYDEVNGALTAGIRFWQVDSDKPLRATLYEIDGYTEYIKKKSKLEVLQPKRSYRQIQVKTKADGTKIYNGENYPGFPIVPLWANPHHQSELVGLREGIDCYDLIKSGFANDLDDASMIYWTLENAGGMDDVSLAQFVERMKTVKAAVVDGDSGAKAEAHTIDVPYAAREAILERIQKDLYRDAQILDVESLSAAQKTATEIRAAYQPMDNKVDQYEYCVLEFLRGIFDIVEIEDNPSFTRNRIANQMEETQMILMAAQYLDDETLLSKLPWLTQEEIQQILDRKETTDMNRFGITQEQSQNEETNNEADSTKGGTMNEG